ncbi:DUF2971 domain-containing protein [Aliarcobacter butzleri]|uniref:DUF2971 domain-containing protein n=1 Tax=Aliarcobacter butzleri TaxID=28197 RepID=UPI0018A06D9D|nr:DUF2971 domain-containing protein [Aliarcobacter butzleri]MBF7066319.1 DUF2971 domain-containing protein [Aliarcobacter butzleri]
MKVLKKIFMTEELTDFLNSDDAIFHYTKKETAMEYILNDKKLKFGLFHSTNDPHEYKKRLTPAFGWGDINESLYLESMNLIDNTIQNTAFLSFCENSNNKGYEKPRMWSQYGQNHSGICLVFSKESLIKTIQNQLSQNYLVYHENVNYKEIDFESLNIYDNALTINEIVINNIKQNYKNIFFQKHLDYKDENEFRIVLVKRNNNNFSKDIFIDISDSLKFIILGDKFPEVYLPTIKDLSSKSNIAYKKLHWEQNQYFLLS